MDNPRIFLWVGLALLLWMNVIQWKRDYGAPAPDAGTSAPRSERCCRGAGGTAARPVAGRCRRTPAQPRRERGSGSGSARRRCGDRSRAQAPRVRVVTDVLDIDVSLQGGTLDRADLLKYPQSKTKDSPPVRLLTTAEGELRGRERSGLRAAGGGAEPTHLATFTAAAPGVPARARRSRNCACRSPGPTARASPSPRPTSSSAAATTIDLAYDVDNAVAGRTGRRRRTCSSRGTVCAEALDVRRRELRVPRPGDLRRQEVPQAQGRPTRTTRSSPRRSPAAGWPQCSIISWRRSCRRSTETFDYTLERRRARIPCSASADRSRPWPPARRTVQREAVRRSEAAGAAEDRGAEARSHRRLRQAHDHRAAAVLAAQLGARCSSATGAGRSSSLTILIKLPASTGSRETSGRSMAKMRNLAPRMKALQERYKDEREQLGREMMELYKNEKINPVGRLSADARADPVLPRVLLGAARERRNAPGAVWCSGSRTSRRAIRSSSCRS